jgi:hypothetical protein
MDMNPAQTETLAKSFYQQQPSLTDIAKEIDSRDDRAHYLPHVIPKPI